MQDNQTGSRDLNPIRLLAGIFLLYLSWRLLSGVINGESEHIALSVCGVVLFAGCGAFLLIWELRAHRLFLNKGKNKTETEPDASTAADGTEPGGENTDSAPDGTEPAGEGNENPGDGI